MAKQSFSVGQVLTAAQMTSLQQTAMLGGSATAKTTSYTLVAADAGTVVSVNSTSATTITVNTGLFSAGDTVTIQNWGSGAVTITAGTATVNTAGSLIVPQYDGGVLYFTSASAAIYFDFVQAGAVSPLTTKGDLYTFGSSDTRLGVGANGTTLVADSAEATGLKWATPASGGMTLISTTTLTGASVTLSSIPQTYIDLKIYIRQFLPATDDALLRLRFNADSTANRYKNLEFGNGNNWNISYNADTFEFGSGKGTDDTVGESLCTLEIPDYTNTVTRKMTWGFVTFISAINTANFNHNTIQSYYSQTGAISSLVFAPSTGNFTSGTILLYGVK